ERTGVEMNCQNFIEDLQAYLDGELPDARRNEIAAHLTACSECAKTITDLKDVSGLMQSWPTPEPKLPTGPQMLQQARPPEGRLLRFVRGFYQLPFKVKAPIFATAALVVISLFITSQYSLKSASYSPGRMVDIAETRSYQYPASTPPPPVAENK